MLFDESRVIWHGVHGPRNCLTQTPEVFAQRLLAHLSKQWVVPL